MRTAATGCEVVGVVVSVGRGDLHAVDVAVGDTTRRVLARRCGRMNVARIRLLAGDRCTVELDPYDPSRGRIVRRLDGAP